MTTQRIDPSNAQKAALEAAARQREIERARAEQARLAAEQARQRGEEVQEPKADDPETIDKDTFVNDPAVAEQLGKSKEELAALYDQAAALDGDAGLSNGEIETLFLAVAEGKSVADKAAERPLSSLPKTDEAGKTPGALEKNAEPKSNDPAAVVSKLEKLEKDLKSNGIVLKSGALDKYKAAKARYEELSKLGQGDAAAAVDLTKAATELMHDLTAQKFPTKAAQDKAGEFLSSMRDDVALLRTGKTGAQVTGQALDKLGKLAGVLGTLGAVLSGVNADGKPLDAPDIASLPLQFQAGLKDLAEGVGAKELSTTYRLISRHAMKHLEASVDSPALKKLVKAADGLARNLLSKAAGAETFTKELLEKATFKLEAYARLVLGKEGLGKLTSALNFAGAALGAANMGIMAGTALYQALDFLLTGFVAVRGGVAKLHDAGMRNVPANELLEQYTASEATWKRAEEDLADGRGKPEQAQLVTTLAEDARKQNSGVVNHDLLGVDYSRKPDLSRVEQVETRLRETNAVATLPDGSQVPAAGLYERLKTGGEKALSDAEHVALAGPLAKAAREVVTADMIKNKFGDFSNLAPQHFTLDVAKQMDGLQLQGYLASLPPSALDQVPIEVRKHAFTEIADSLGSKIEAEAANTAGQLIGMRDARHGYLGQLMASMLRTTSPGTSNETTKDLEAHATSLYKELMGKEGDGGGVFTTNRAILASEVAKNMSADELKRLPTEVLQDLADQSSKGMLYAKDENVKNGVRFAEAIRAKGGEENAKLADVVEKRFTGENTDDVVRERVALLSDAELNKLPAAQKLELAKALYNADGQSISPTNVPTLMRLSESLRRSQEPGGSDPKLAQAIVDRLGVDVRDDGARLRAESLTVDELAKLPKPELDRMITSMENMATVTEEGEKAAIAKIALALVIKAGEGKEGPDREAAMAAAYQEVRGKLDNEHLDDVANHVVALLGANGQTKTPPTNGLEDLPQAMKQAMFDDVMGTWSGVADLASASKLARSMTGDAGKAAQERFKQQVAQDDRALAELSTLDEAAFKQAVKDGGPDLMKALQSATLWTNDDKLKMVGKVAAELIRQGDPAARAEVYKQAMDSSSWMGRDNVTNAIVENLSAAELAALPKELRTSMREQIQGSFAAFTTFGDDHAALAKLKAADTTAEKQAAVDYGRQQERDGAQGYLNEYAKLDDAALQRSARTRPDLMRERLGRIRAHVPAGEQRDATIARLEQALAASTTPA